MEGKIAVSKRSPDMEDLAAENSPKLTIVALADQLFRKRKGRVLTLGQASEQIGVSVATLSRLERLRHGEKAAAQNGTNFSPDTRTLTAVARWLDIPLGQIVVQDEVVSSEASTSQPASAKYRYREGENLPDVVEAHLRADRQLDGEAALALAQMFRMAYDQFSRLPTTDAATDSSEKKER